MRRGSIAIEQFVAVGIALTVIVVILLGAAAKVWPGFMQFLGVAGLDNETGTGSLIARAWTDFDATGQLKFHLVEGSGITRARAQDTFAVYELFDANPSAQPLCMLEQLRTMSPVRSLTQGAGSGDFDIDWTITKNPGAFGTRWLCIRVYDDNADDLQNPPLLVRINSWQFLLFRYVNTNGGILASRALFPPHNTALRWSHAMHNNPSTVVGACSFPPQQSLCADPVVAGPARTLAATLSMGRPFRDILVSLGCTNPASPDPGYASEDIKEIALQEIVTALFGDIQDFGRESGRPPTAGQPVPRLADGMGPRGYSNDEISIVGMTTWSNQLYPITLSVRYPAGSLGPGFTLDTFVRGADPGGSPTASMTFASPSASCFGGRDINVDMRVCTSCGGG